MSGYYQLQRGWMNHPIFKKETFTERTAWVWMIEEAAWKNTKTRLNGKIVIIKRGQFSHSIRYLSERWGWSRGKTERFINVLKTETMIETATETGQLIITICNYDKYQSPINEVEPQDGTLSGTILGQQRDREEEREEGNKDISEANASSISPPPPKKSEEKKLIELPEWLDRDAWNAFVEMRKKIPRSVFTDNAQRLALKELESLRTRGHDPTELLERSTSRGWKGFYPKEEADHGTNRFDNSNTTQRASKDDRAKAAVMRAAERLGFADSGKP